MNLSGKTVLIVDDEPFMLALLTHVLGNLGATLLMAVNGKDALALAEKNTIHAVIVDYYMEGWDGVETISRIKLLSQYRQLPAILLTSRGQALIRQKSEASGITAFFTKPFSPSELTATVGKLLSAPAQNSYEVTGGGG